jgi:hypothetical protein
MEVLERLRVKLTINIAQGERKVFVKKEENFP